MDIDRMREIAADLVLDRGGGHERKLTSDGAGKTAHRRLRDAVGRLSMPGYRFWACRNGHLHLGVARDDVETGGRREFTWRRAWPGDVLAAAGVNDLPLLASLVSELAFAELVREAAHEVAERLRWDGLVVVDPHPGGQWAAGDGVGDAEITIRFGPSGRTR